MRWVKEMLVSMSGRYVSESKVLTCLTNCYLKGLISNILEEDVVQPLLVSTSAIELATETVSLLLKIDDCKCPFHFMTDIWLMANEDVMAR
jgi:hypothetical protein